MNIHGTVLNVERYILPDFVGMLAECHIESFIIRPTNIQSLIV